MKKEKLHNINATGFKSPDNYFEAIDAEILDKINVKNAIQNIENTGFSLPDNYFETVENKILDAVTEEKQTKVISLSSRKKLYYITGIAASLLLLFAIFINQTKTETLTVEIVESYLAERDLDSYDLAELLSDVNVLDENFTLVETNYTEENLETYLLENADIESILE